MVKCKICEKNDDYYSTGYCKYCYDVKFYLKDSFKEYLKGASAQNKLVSALGNFSWIYAGYPRFWGFYNGIINVIYYFLPDPTKVYISEANLEYFEFTDVDTADILLVLYEAKVLKEPTAKTPPSSFEKGELTDMVVRRVSRELDPTIPANRRRRKRSMQEMFGIVSMVLTYVLMKKKLTNPKGKVLPRKSLSLFLLLTHHILNNYTVGTDIPETFSMNLLNEQHSLMKLPKRTQMKFMFEMLGLSYVSPGKTNVISNVDMGSQTLYLNEEVRELLEYWRERRRDRFRTRHR